MPVELSKRKKRLRALALKAYREGVMSTSKDWNGEKLDDWVDDGTVSPVDVENDIVDDFDKWYCSEE